MRGRRPPRRAARRRSTRANVILPRVASHDRFLPMWAAARAAACRAGQVGPRLAFLDTALLETLSWSSLPSVPLSAHRLPDVRRALQQPDALSLTAGEVAPSEQRPKRHILS